jgi:hypothetical protein
MAWVEHSRETTVAPRDLKRLNPKRDMYGTPSGFPSVGGNVETEHVTWRCYSCRKWAVTTGGQPSRCCCGAR